MEKIGERIRAIREEKNFAQIGVAMGAGISQAALSKIEKGLMKPSIDTLCKLAKSLGVDVRDFFPPALANEVLGTDSLLGTLWFRLRRWWAVRKVRPL